MKVTLTNKELIAPNGQPFLGQRKKDADGKEVVEHLSLFDACADVLTQQIKGDDELGFKKTCERQDLAKAFYDAQKGENQSEYTDVELDAEDVTMIETRAAKIMTGPVCWAIREAMKC